MLIKSYPNVWGASPDPVQEVLNKRLRSELMIKCTELIDSWNTSQKESSKKLGISQPRLNNLLKGKIDKFSLDALVNILSAADMDIELTVKPATKSKYKSDKLAKAY